MKLLLSILLFVAGIAQAQTPLYVGKFAGDAASGVSNTWGRSLELLKQPPPLIGVLKTVPGNYQTGGNNSGGYSPAAAGVSGVVNSLWCVPDVASTTIRLGSNLRNLHLRIYADCGNNTNPPPAGNLCVDAPLDLLFNDRFRDPTNGQYMLIKNTKWLDTLDASTNDVFANCIMHFTLKAPMPFTNGIFCTLFHVAGGTNWTRGYFNAMMATGSVSDVWSNFRFKTALYEGNPTGGVSNVLCNLNNAGTLLGMHISTLNETANADCGAYFDTVGPRWVGPAPNYDRWEPSGFDDFLQSTYSISCGPFCGYDYGIANYWITYSAACMTKWKIEAYKWFDMDAFRWNNGVTCWFQPQTTINETDFLFFYYGN